MATSFSAAALGAEGLAADVTMLVGNGYVPGPRRRTRWRCCVARAGGAQRCSSGGCEEDDRVTRILLRGGHVHTPADPHATAICVDDGVVVWLGDDAAPVHFADSADRVVDSTARWSRRRSSTPTCTSRRPVSLRRPRPGRTTVARARRSTRLAAYAAGHRRCGRRSAPAGTRPQWPERPRRYRGGARPRRRRPAGVTCPASTCTRRSSSTAFLDGVPAAVALDGLRRRPGRTRDAHHAVRDALFDLDRRPSTGTDAVAACAGRPQRGPASAMVHEMAAPAHRPADATSPIVRARPPAGCCREVVGYWGELGARQGRAPRAAPAPPGTCTRTARSARGRRPCGSRTPTAGRPRPRST